MEDFKESQIDEGHNDLQMKLRFLSSQNKQYHFISYIQTKNQPARARYQLKVQENSHKQYTFQDYPTFSNILGQKTNRNQSKNQNEQRQLRSSINSKRQMKQVVCQKNNRLSKLKGQSVVRLKNGCLAFGNWQGGKLQGQAKFIYPTQDTYIGQVKGCQKNGKGQMRYRSGSRYVGEFVNDKYQGYGQLYDQTNNLRWKGIWKKGKLIRLHID